MSNHNKFTWYFALFYSEWQNGRMVGVLGLEPRSLAAQDFESSVFTNFTILPHGRRLREATLYHCFHAKSNAVNEGQSA